jgi:RNA polymerase sigma-70 factor (ECF subfamily)
LLADDELTLASDGLYERPDRAGQQSEGRIVERLARCLTPGRAMHGAVLEVLTDVIGDQPRHDDISVLTVLRRGEIRTWNRDELRNSGDDSDRRWAHAAADLRAYREAQRARWGDVDDAALSRFVAGLATTEDRGRISTTMLTHPDLRKCIETVREVLAAERFVREIRTPHTPSPVRQAAMHQLIGRYHEVVERYLRLKLRDTDLADEVFQEFWTKLLTHKLAGADSNKGRFRDYLRTVLHRLIIDYFRVKKLQPLPPGDLLDEASPDTDYDRVWREVVIKRAMSRLETYESNTPKNRYHTVLQLRRTHPKAPIEDLAAQLSQQIGGPVTPEAFRKTLQRSRSKFLELLIQELRETIHPAEPEDVEAEIIDLGLGSLYGRYGFDL